MYFVRREKFLAKKAPIYCSILQLRMPNLHGYPNSIWNEIPRIARLSSQRLSCKVSCGEVFFLVGFRKPMFFRNCVIDKNFTVKISDHAMYCDRYEPDYYVSDTKARLPIRWMSWESLLLVRC